MKSIGAQGVPFETALFNDVFIGDRLPDLASYA
jgi:hypothetical protein